MRQSTRVIANSAVSFVRQALNMALQVFLLAFILRRVDSEAYGLFLLAVGLQTLLDLLRNSINKGCLVRVAQCIETGDDLTISKVTSSAVIFLTVPAGLALVVAALAGRPAAHFFGVGAGLQDAMAWMLLLAGVDVLLVLPLAPFTAVVAAHQRYGLISLADTGSRFLRAAVIVVLFRVLGAHVVFVMVATVIGDVVMRAVLMFCAYRLTPGLRVRVSLCDRAVLWSLLAFGSFLIYGDLAIMAASETSKWIVGKALSLDHVTFLSVAGYTTVAMGTAVRTMTLVLVPVASRFKARMNEGVLQDMLLRGTRYSSLVSMLVLAVVLPSMRPLLGLWLTPGMAWIAPYAVAMGIVDAISIPGNCAEQILNGVGDSRRPFQANLAWGVVATAVTAVTVCLLGWGFAGAVIGVSSGKVVAWVLHSAFALRTIPVSRPRFVWQAYAQPLLAAIPAFAAGALLTYVMALDSWGKLAAAWAVGLAVYVVCFLPHVTGAEWNMARGAMRTALSLVRRREGI